MGNRSAIVVNAEAFKTPITFYGHWSGKDNLEAVRNVLARTGRIGDASYLAAQIFFEFAKLGNYDGDVSFGIDAFGGDPDSGMDNATIYVNADTGEYTRRGIINTEFVPVKKTAEEMRKEERENGGIKTIILGSNAPSNGYGFDKPKPRKTKV
jgi:hypothetical protein